MEGENFFPPLSPSLMLWKKICWRKKIFFFNFYFLWGMRTINWSLLELRSCATLDLGLWMEQGHQPVYFWAEARQLDFGLVFHNVRAWSTIMEEVSFVFGFSKDNVKIHQNFSFSWNKRGSAILPHSHVLINGTESGWPNSTHRTCLVSLTL